MPKQLRFEVFTEKTDQFKEQTLGATPSLYQGSPAGLAFAFFDSSSALVPIAARYTDITLEVWEDQDAGARRLQKTVAALDFDASCTLPDWTAKTKAPVVFALTGEELDLEIAAGKTSRTFYMVVGGTPVDGEPETLGYATLQLLKDRFGEPSDPVDADPASYLTAAQSDARYARLTATQARPALTGGGAALDGEATLALPVSLTLRACVVGGGLSWWQLVAGTDAENAGAGIVRPDDYAGGTNEKVWKQVL
jgi:hypothetical protein